MIETTSHQHVQLLADTSVYHWFKTLTHQRQYKQLGGYLGKFASERFKANVISMRGNLYAQHFFAIEEILLMLFQYLLKVMQV